MMEVNASVWWWWWWWVVGGGRHGRMRGGRLVDSCVKFQILEDE